MQRLISGGFTFIITMLHSLCVCIFDYNSDICQNIWEKILCNILCHAPLTKFTVIYFCDIWTWPCLGAFRSAVEVQTGVKGVPAERGGKRERVEAVIDAFEKQTVVIMGTNFSWEQTIHVMRWLNFSSSDTFITYIVNTGSLTTCYIMSLYNSIEKMGQCKITGRRESTAFQYFPVFLSWFQSLSPK